MRLKFFILSVIFLALFTLFSYHVAKEELQQFDFDTTVKIQDHISRKYDGVFSYFSLLGSVEVTFGICLVLSFLSLIRGKWLATLAWLLVIPASAGEVFGKLVLFHPSPPVFLHRSILPTSLPSFYVHTDFSYPSGHMTRTIFIMTVFFCIIFLSGENLLTKWMKLGIILLFAFLMALTRVYLGEHWFSDVVGGALLGMGVGFLSSMLIFSRRKL